LEVSAIEVASTEKGAAYTSLLRALIDRGLHGVGLVVSDNHESMMTAGGAELPGAERQRCIAHFERSVLLHALATSMSEVAEDLKAIFMVEGRRLSWL
jgi:putative transposase